MQAGCRAEGRDQGLHRLRSIGQSDTPVKHERGQTRLGELDVFVLNPAPTNLRHNREDNLTVLGAAVRRACGGNGLNVRRDLQRMRPGVDASVGPTASGIAGGTPGMLNVIDGEVQRQPVSAQGAGNNLQEQRSVAKSSCALGLCLQLRQEQKIP